MNEYNWKLKDGSKSKLSFSANFDNLITKYRNNVVVESVFLMDCGIVQRMPCILRYCFEEKVNLKENKFLSEIHDNNDSLINKAYLDQDFQRSLSGDDGPVRLKGGNLIIYSSPNPYNTLFSKIISNPSNSSISFNSEDVSELVEGIIKVLDYDGVRLAQIKSIQTVQYYHQCLDNGLLG